MNEHACVCGYDAATAEELRDHFGEMFTPDDDMSRDGEIHAEAACDPASAGLACLCGSAADSIASLDEFSGSSKPNKHTGATPCDT